MDKPLFVLHGTLKTPPLSEAARIEAGILLRRVQQGDTPTMPQSRPMPGIAPGCHELRIQDTDMRWRIVLYVDEDVVLVLDVWKKTTAKTPARVIENCRRRLRAYRDQR